VTIALYLVAIILTVGMLAAAIAIYRIRHRRTITVATPMFDPNDRDLVLAMGTDMVRVTKVLSATQVRVKLWREPSRLRRWFLRLVKRP
jgi:Flp pilus assembly protein CpaB